MKYLKQPYYIGLLSAASYFGASHQAVQILQVVTNKPLRPITAGRGTTKFITKKNFETTPTVRKNTRTGTVAFSTPEATAFDLIRFPRQSLYLSHIATVLIELSEVLDGKKLVALAKDEPDIHLVQRLGYLLDRFTKAKTVAKELNSWLAKRSLKPTILDPSSYSSEFRLDKKWQVLVNEKVEPDDV